MPSDPTRAQEVFAAALALADPAARAELLDRECGPDGDLRRRVEELLAAHAAAADPLVPTGPYVPQPDPPWPTVPGYELLSVLGRGGMGVVYKARQEAADRLVALKVVRAGEFASPGERARFRAEAEAAARLRHPGVVRVYEVGEQAGTQYFTMEYCEAGSLADRLAGAPWAAAPAARLAELLADALEAAHRAGIVHRDLKPANVLFGRINESDAGSITDARLASLLYGALRVPHGAVPKVTDFGLSRRTDSSDGPTATGEVLGTPSYMAPEQAVGARGVGPAADVYGLGAILYELLTGRPPFKSGSALDTLELVKNQEPVAPRALNPKTPRDLETICLKCLEKDPAKRYPGAGAFADDLRRFQEGRPIVARPVGVPERSWRWCKRNPAVASLLAAVLLVFAAGAGGSIYYAVQSNYRADQATNSERKTNLALGEVKKEKDEVQKKNEELELKTEEAEGLLYDHQAVEAAQATSERDAELLLAKLAEARHQPSGRDHRGWEWYYLDRVARPFAHQQRFDERSGMLAASAGLFSEFGPRRVNMSLDGRTVIRAPTSPPAEPGPGALYDCMTGRELGEIPFAQPSAKMAGVEVSSDGWFVAWVESAADQVVLSPAADRAGPAPAADHVTPLLFGPPPEGEYHIRVVNRETGRQEVVLGPFPILPRVRMGAGGERLTALLDPEKTLFGLPVHAGQAGHVGRDGRYPRLVVWRRGQDQASEVQIRTGPDNLAYAPVVVSPDASLAVVLHTPKAPSDRPDLLRDTALELWDLTSPPRRRGEPISNADGLAPLAFSADGAYLAVLHAPRSVVVYETTHFKQVGRWDLPADAPLAPSVTCSSGAVSSDGRRVAMSGSNGWVLVGERRDAPSAGQPAADVGRWRTGLVQGPVLRAVGAPLDMFTPLLAFSPGGELVIGGCRAISPAPDNVVWTVPLPAGVGYAASWPDSLTADGLTFRPIPAAGPRIVYLPEGSGLAAAGGKPRDWPVLVWDVAAAKAVRRLTVTGVSVIGADVSGDGRRLLVGVQASESSPGGVPPLPPLVLPPLPPGGGRDPGKPPPEVPPKGGQDKPPALVLPPLPDLPPFPNLPPAPGRANVYRASLHDLDDPGARELATFVSHGVPTLAGGRWVLEPGDGPQECEIRSAETGAVALELKPRAGEHFGPVFFQRDGRRLLVATRPEPTDPGPDRPTAPASVTLRCFDPDSARELWTAPLPEPLPVTVTRLGRLPTLLSVEEPQTEFAPDGRRLAVFVKVGKASVRGWVLDAATGEVVRAVRADGDESVPARLADLPPSVGAITFGPGDRLAAAFGKDVLVWDGRGAEPAWRLPQPDWMAGDSVFTADGRRLLTLDPASLLTRGSATLRVWDLAAGRQLLEIPVLQLEGGLPLLPGADPTARRLRLDGDRLLVPTPDGIRVFDGSPRED